MQWRGANTQLRDHAQIGKDIQVFEQEGARLRTVVPRRPTCAVPSGPLRRPSASRRGHGRGRHLLGRQRFVLDVDPLGVDKRLAPVAINAVTMMPSAIQPIAIQFAYLTG